MGSTRRRAAGVVLAVAVVCGGLLAGAPVATADEGLTVAATSTYVLDTRSTAVRVTVSIDLHNISPNEKTTGGVYTYYYDGFSVPVAAGARDLRARSEGAALPVTLEGTDDPSTALARVGFPELTYDQSRHIDLGYTVPGAPPRSRDTTRVGRGYATFVATGPGDSGHNVVQVVVPGGMSFTSTSEGFERTSTGETDTWSTSVNTYDAGIWAVVSVRDPAQIDERSVDASGTPLLLESFPGDRAWTDFVEGVVKHGIPTLERLVGTPWPGGLQRIREDATPSLRGYDGWFDPSDAEIVVGEALDEDLIIHELSHAWLSGERFDQRWQYEGLAQAVAERVVTEDGGTPSSHDTVTPSDRLAVPLAEWGGGAGSRSTDVDGWAYPAAYRVTKDLLGRLDDSTFAAVVGAGVRGERAYDPPGTPDHTGGRTTWQRWLDLVESRGGVKAAPALFATWVLTPAQAADLPARARERTAYSALDTADGPWLPPEGLRDAMTDWDFERAAHVRQAVTGLGADAVAVQQAAAAAGLEVPDTVRSSYEDAAFDEQYTGLATSLPAAARAVTAVGRARAVAGAERGPFGDLGVALLGLQDRAARATTLVEGGEIAPAQQAADDVRARAAWVLPLGVGAPGLALVLFVGMLTVVVVALRRGSEHPKHARVAQRVRLDPLEVEELRDPLVVGAQQLGVHRGVDGLPVDRGEPVPAEEGGLEGEAEEPREAEPVRPLDEAAEEQRAHAAAQVGGVDRERAHLPEVLPEHVQRSAPDDPAR